jgi:hypothetical protein
MIMRYQILRQFPEVFVKLTGLGLREFEQLLAEVTPRYHEAQRRRRARPDRQRAIGGGDHMDLNVADQLLLTLIYRHHYPRQEVMGHFFDISQPTVWRCIDRMTPILEQVQCASVQPDPGRKQRQTMGELLDNIPELIGVISYHLRSA